MSKPTPAKIVDEANAPTTNTKSEEYILNILRDKINELDNDIMYKMASRMNISKQIGQYKKKYNIDIFQTDRWQEIVKTRVPLGIAMGMEKDFMHKLLDLIHEESIRIQTEVMSNKENGV